MESAVLRMLEFSVNEGFVSMVGTCVLGILVIYLAIYQHRGYFVDLTSRSDSPLPPGNDGLPFIGETLLLAAEKDDFFRIRRSKFGSIFRTHLFGCPAVRITGEDNIKYLLQIEDQHLRSFYPTSVRRLIGCTSLVTASGLAHRQKKRVLTRFLSRDFLHHHVPHFSAVVSRHLANWASEDMVDIYPACKTLTVEIALRCLVDLQPSSTQVDDIRARLCEFTDNLFCFPLYLPGTSYYTSYNAKRKLLDILDDLQRSKKQDDPVGSPPALLTNSENTMETLDTLFEMLFVGADNNGSGIFAIVHLLARHPKVVEKAYKEQDRAWLLDVANESACPDDVQWEQFTDMPYIRAVVKECLRLLPPVGGLYRTVTKGFVINGYYIPKGWRLLAGIRETHENDLGLKDPLTFDPERWLSGDKKPAFLTFGGGVRACPGHHYADLLLRVFVVELVRHWTVQIIRDSKITMFPSVKPSGAMMVRLSPLQTSDNARLQDHNVPQS